GSSSLLDRTKTGFGRFFRFYLQRLGLEPTARLSLGPKLQARKPQYIFRPHFGVHSACRRGKRVNEHRHVAGEMAWNVIWC
ncbi:hypothetical protein, partial [Sinorhizobium sp. GL28]|uniref:hypothetical protein n=1 Tax=Sinorhizobium sp. GL28 TaxID=1358418 RepID=UPI001AECB34B